jgi:beta-lactamase class A
MTLATLAAAQPPSGLPVQISDGDWQPLSSQVDRRLQARLEQALRHRAEWRQLIDKEQMAVGLVDLGDPARPRFARINGRKMMYAASLPKIGILLAAFHQVAKGKLRKTPDVEHDLSAMIRFSDNAAATRMIDRLGGLEAVNRVLAAPEYSLYDSRANGGLWVGKRYAKAGGRFPDPINGISHGATVTQVCRFYYLLATGRLINREMSREMLEYLSEPGIEHKFVKTLHDEAPDAQLFRKSGTWRNWHADSVLVWGPNWRRYILVALVENPRGEQILRDLVRVAEQALKPQRPHPAPKLHREQPQPGLEIHESSQLVPTRRRGHAG